MNWKRKRNKERNVWEKIKQIFLGVTMTFLFKRASKFSSCNTVDPTLSSLSHFPIPNPIPPSTKQRRSLSFSPFHLWFLFRIGHIPTLIFTNHTYEKYKYQSHVQSSCLSAKINIPFSPLCFFLLLCVV